MPTELEELVEFLHHGNTQIRQIATENLVPYSKSEPSIFKSGQLTPIKDLKLLVKDYAPIAQNALTILINISGDEEVLKALARDDSFLETILVRMTNPKEPNADSLAMLLANLSKSDSLSRLLTLKRSPMSNLSNSPLALDQLIELFNRGTNKGYNPAANFDYLAYVFADLAKHAPIRNHLLNSIPQDPLPPLTSILPSTTHHSSPRRLGTSTLLRNLTLALPTPLPLLHPPISILPHLLLPLCGPTPPSLTESEIDTLLPELQYLGPEQQRERDPRVLAMLLEALYLIVARGGSEAGTMVRNAGAYIVVRELHLEVEDEGVRGLAERIVDLLMVEAEGEGGTGQGAEIDRSQLEDSTTQKYNDNDDDDGKVIEIF